MAEIKERRVISIHAPSRERRLRRIGVSLRSSDFNPRSLTGATEVMAEIKERRVISIHAPSRERRLLKSVMRALNPFQSTLPHGSDSC